MISLLSKTDDFVKKMINLFNKTDDIKKKRYIYLVKQVLAGPDMSDFRLLVQFGTFQVQKWYFDAMT